MGLSVVRGTLVASSRKGDLQETATGCWDGKSKLSLADDTE